ncbi:DUF488 domain-containing protein [Thioclava sp.]|uniref:DUF488 domain-containing protein n=1 Tax=Thioclava sp. TaxID=1933450 RepID=UPI003AA98862
MTSTASIRIARVYDDLGETVGARLLVDRVWPRGIAKERLGLNEWIKEAAPSTELRKWFDHVPEKWERFRERYWAELESNPGAVERCLDWCRKGPVILLYAAKDRDFNQAVVLRDYLNAALKQGRPA